MLRKKAGKTVGELAKAVGVSELTMYCYEANTRTLPPDLYPAIAESLGVSARQLLPIE
jgi:transcriptional regulator with XRE-family HTH domain